MPAARILVVDDSLTIRRALEFILKPQGYALDFAADGRDALSHASSFDPDLVLLDYVLPDMRGPDVCAALAVMPQTAGTPVILVSAKGASIRQAYHDAQNVVSYITKPFKAEVVTAVVANALARLRSAAPPSAHDDAAGRAAPAAAPPDAASPAPSTVDETFSALLGQLEDAIAGDAALARRDGRVPSRLGPELHRATERMRDLAQHVAGDRLAPYRLRPDGSFASVAATLLEAHRCLCEAAIALAAAGAPAARLPGPARVVAACPAAYPLRADLIDALRVAPEVSAIVIESEFAQLPSLVRLLAPECVIAAPGSDPDLDAALARARSVRADGTRFVALGAPSGDDSGQDAGGGGFEERLEDGAAVARLVGDLAARAITSGEAAADIEMEIVTV